MLIESLIKELHWLHVSAASGFYLLLYDIRAWRYCLKNGPDGHKCA